MMLKATYLAALGSLGFGLAGLAHAAAAEDPTGYWATEKDESQVHITHCGGDKLCGTLFWMKNPSDAKGSPMLDKENEDEAKRKRPLLGIQFISMKSEDDYWKGTVYNPQNGKTYDATLKILSKNQVELKGCVAYVLCAGQKWTRAEPKTTNTAEMTAPKSPVAPLHPAPTPAAHKSSAPGAAAPATPAPEAAPADE